MRTMLTILGTIFFAGILILAFLVWIGRSVERRDQAAAAVESSKTSAESLPHDDGNGIAVDPDMIKESTSLQEDKVPAKANEESVLAPLGEGPSYPNVESVIAKEVSAAPGAIVCSNLDRVSFVFRLYAEHWTEVQQDVLTRGASRAVHGEPMAAPDPADYDCVLIPPGTPMLMQRMTGIPFVSARLKNGTSVKGVTLDAMIAEQLQPTPPRT